MKTIFQKGDKVFDIQFGWGEVTKYTGCRHFLVRFKNSEVNYHKDGARFPSPTPMLSFTEYTLDGFSQERPIDYNDYIGKWGAFWDDGDDYRLIDKFEEVNDGLFKADEGGWFHNFKPLTDEQIKILEL